MIHVIATIELAPGTRDAYLAVFRKLKPGLTQSHKDRI